MPRDLGRATAGDVDELRIATWRAGAAHPDRAVRERFLARYPSEAGFDGWAWKEFLGLTPEARVVGVDALPEGPSDARLLTAVASRFPDDDKRNVERFAHGPDRRVRTDASGKPIPRDPAQLDMGAATGLSSQAWAHYGLPRVEFSDDPDVLKADPRRWAYPPTAKAFAPEMAQMHTDVALAAATAGTPGGRALGYVWLGAAHHYVEDVANQIHTLQAVYPFFVDAKIESWKENLFSLWGRLRPRPGFVEIGLGIIKNHHLFLEDLWGARVFDAAEGGTASPGAAAGLTALVAGDPTEEAGARRAPPRPGGPLRPEHRRAGHRRLEPRGRRGLPGRSRPRPLAPLPGRLRVPGRDRRCRAPAVARSGSAWRGSTSSRRKGFGRAASAVRRHVRLFDEEVARAGRSEADRLAVRESGAPASGDRPDGRPRRRGHPPRRLAGGEGHHGSVKVARSRAATSSGHAMEKRSPRSRCR